MASSKSAQSPILTCPQHDEELDCFCNACRKRICEKCVKAVHKDHDWTFKRKFALNAKKEGKVKHDYIHNDVIPKLKEHHRLDHTKVNAVRQKLKQMVDEYADSLLKKLDLLDGNDAQVESEIEKMTSFAEFFMKAIHTADDNVIMEVTEDFHLLLQKVNSPRPKGFQDGTMNREHLHEIFGRVDVNTRENEQSRTKVEVTNVAAFEHGKDIINSVVAIKENKAWVHCYNQNQIDLMDKDGNTHQVRRMGTAFADFCLSDDDIIITLYGAKLIRRVSPSGDVTDICSTAPLCPIGICPSRDGGILVSLSDCDAPDITSESQGEVRRLTVTGKILTSYNKDQSGRKLFTSPYRIAQNINGDLCVVDMIDKDWRSRLVVLTNTGQVRFTYTGQSSLKERFSLGIMCCDQYGRIILPDLHNHAIHMLSPDGEFIQFLLTRDDGVWGPRAVAVHDATLWIGCEEGVVKVLQWKNNNN